MERMFSYLGRAVAVSFKNAFTPKIYLGKHSTENPRSGAAVFVAQSLPPANG
jgi:hypothetical protein